MWGWGGRGGPLCSNQPATEIKGREAQVPDGEGESTHRGGAVLAFVLAFSIKNKNKGEKNYFEKKKVQTMLQTTSGSLTHFRGIGDGREPRGGMVGIMQKHPLGRET